MGAYPRMFALLDVERARAAFATFTTPGWPESDPPLDSVQQERHRSLSELSGTLSDDLNWLHDVPEGPYDWQINRQIFTLIEEGQALGESIYFCLSTRFRQIVPVLQRHDRVLILIQFVGEKKHDMLATDDPPHGVILNFLRRVQPVHAFVTLDTLNPGSDLPNDPGSHKYFHTAQRRVFDSTFLGPELTRLIPTHLLDPANGFSHLERAGEGLWITFEKKISVYSSEWDDSTEAHLDAHRAACQRLTDFLQTLPPDALA